MDKTYALKLLKSHLTNDNLKKHCVAVALIMQAVAKKCGFDEEKFYVCGLLHDIDFDYTKDTPKKHGIKACELLKNEDIQEDVLHAIKAHTDNASLNTFIDKALYASDPLSGLIAAAALMRPEKTISSLPLKSLKKRFKDKRFAKGASREKIKTCEEINIPLDEFLQLGIDALK